MSDRNPKFAEQLAAARPTTRHLVGSILFDAWPNLASAVDFGIESQKHYEALYFPIREAEIMPKGAFKNVTVSDAWGNHAGDTGRGPRRRSKADCISAGSGQQSTQRRGVPHLVGLGPWAGVAKDGGQNRLEGFTERHFGIPRL